MRKGVKLVLIAVVGLLLAWVVAGCFYFAQPLAGRVVEAGTPTPLPGVTVVADWQHQGGMEGGTAKGHVAIEETVTDADGRFAFPGWGPRFAFPRGRLKERDPWLLLFKAGYFPKTLENRFGSRARGWIHTSDWNNTTILLEPASRYPERYASAVQTFANGIHVSFFNPGGCVWAKIPHLLLALDSEAMALTAKGPLTEAPSLAHWKSAYPECDLNEDYVRRNGEWAR